MNRFVSISFLITAAFQLTPSASLAATYSENLEKCINGNLSQTESDALLTVMTRWKELYAEKLIRDTEDCYEKLTGKLAVLVQGEGLVVGSEAQRVLAERKKREETIFQQPTLREDLKCSLLEEWEALSSEKAEADEILNANALSEDQRQAEAYIATYIACKDWYGSDSTGALTSAVCSPFFLEHGVPDTEISGPTPDEILASRQTSRLASVKLNSLDVSLRQVEFDEDYVNDYSEEALYDLNKRVAAEMEAQAALQAPSDGEPLSSCEVLWLKWKSEN